jgi:hypothetical protein
VSVLRCASAFSVQMVDVERGASTSRPSANARENVFTSRAWRTEQRDHLIVMLWRKHVRGAFVQFLRVVKCILQSMCKAIAVFTIP